MFAPVTFVCASYACLRRIATVAYQMAITLRLMPWGRSSVCSVLCSTALSSQALNSNLGIYPMALPVWQNPGPTGVRLELGALIPLVCQQYTAMIHGAHQQFWLLFQLQQRRRLHNRGFLVHHLSRRTGAPLFIALRASTGFGIGTACFVLTVCSSEVSTPHVRRSLSSRLRL